MYFADLTPYEYGRENAKPDVLNIGWLSAGHQFPVGPTSEGFRADLRRLVQAPVNLYRGIHLCEFCPPPPEKLTPSGLRTIDPVPGTFGNGEIRVRAHDITYVAPVLVLHYVEAHSYAPPAEFVRAVESAFAQEPNKTMEPTR